MTRRILRSFAIVVIVSFLSVSTFLAQGADPEKGFRVRGRIICLDTSGRPQKCSASSDEFAIRCTKSVYFFLAEDHKARIFTDPLVRQREIEVEGWLRGSNQLEIIRVFSIKEGARFEIQYFCSVCNIKAFVGGLCWCCQQEFEFREVPVSEQ